RRHTRSTRDWSSDVCSSDLSTQAGCRRHHRRARLRVSFGHATRAALARDHFGRPIMKLCEAHMKTSAAKTIERKAIYTALTLSVLFSLVGLHRAEAGVNVWTTN